jgi:hypothetical protein
MTLGGAAAAQVRLLVWCKDCGYGRPERLRRRHGGLRVGRAARVLTLRQSQRRFRRHRLYESGGKVPIYSDLDDL